MNRQARIVALAVSALALLPALGGAATAQTKAAVTGNILQFTPSCHYDPYASITGRFAGRIGYGSHGAVSVEGCFNSVPECESWLRRASGQIGGRIVLAICEAR